MDTFTTILQIVIAAGIANVWLLRAGKPTAWRGGDSTNLREEFATYGMPAWSVGVIGALKLLCAAGLVVGIWVPAVVPYAAGTLGALMLGAVAMHVKVADPALRSLPAFSLLAACTFVLVV